MEIAFDNKSQVSPRLSIVLVDWSCRDSFHTLDYLNRQTALRGQYEIIWIEYYGRRPNEIEDKLVDKWIIMEMPQEIYYHKHLMYNLGIVVSRGEIICFCDSDAIVRPTFVENILREFKKDPDIVLHIDEVRNMNKRFYPFNNPTIEEIIGKGCINFRNGKTTGIVDQEDPLHARNYGACMSAARESLIKIGAADEHIDYLGHICGPYEMTFRLANLGKKEVWHQEEFLYHTWHPGSDGHNNYLGPHDGKNMSTTALDLRRSGRIMPLIENKAIEALRLNGKSMPFDRLMTEVFSGLKLERWSKYRVREMQRAILRLPRKFSLKSFWSKVLLLRIAFSMLIKQALFKSMAQSQNEIIPKGALTKLRLTFAFMRRMWKNNIYAIRACHQVIFGLKSQGLNEAVIYGSGDIAKILQVIARKFLFKIITIESLNDYKGKIIIASFAGITEKAKRLKNMGIDEKNIVRLQ